MSAWLRLLRGIWLFAGIFSRYVWLFLYVRVGRALSKPLGGVSSFNERSERVRARVHERSAKQLLRGMLRLRGCYVKLGQVLSIMGGFLPPQFTRELEALQDQVPPQPFNVISRVIEKSLGRKPAEIFQRIDEQALAAASLGQVHSAYLQDGRHVAVKVLYPNIRQILVADLLVIRLVIRAYRLFFPVQILDTLHAALVDLLHRETDYLHEADCIKRMAANFRDEKDVVFPEVVDELTTTDVLTMSFVEGIKITRVDEMRAQGVNVEKLARRLVEVFYKQLFVHRLFHADPHPGNFLVQPRANGEANLVILDFGAVSEVPDSLIDGMIEVLQGFFEQNDAKVIAGIDRIGFVAPDGDRALLEQNAKHYFQKLLHIKDRSAGALMKARRDQLIDFAEPEVQGGELRTLMKSIRYPDGWFYVERASVMMFWLVGQIAPSLDTMQIGFPYVLPLLTKKIAANASAQQTLAAL